MKIKHTLTALAFIAGSSAAFGQSVSLNWDLDGEPGDQVSTVGSSTLPSITDLVIDRGPGIGSSTTAGNSISSNGWDSLDADEDFFSIRFTIAPGFSLDLTDLKIGTRSSGTGPGDLGLFYNGNGFSSSLFTFTQSGTAFLNSDIDLSALTGLTGAVEFRLVANSDTRADGDDSSSITSGGTFRVTNFFDGGDTGGFTFTGEVIPEPSTYGALLGAAALALVVARRRMRA